MYVVYFDFRRVKFVDVKIFGSFLICVRVVNFFLSLIDVIMLKCVKYYFLIVEIILFILYFFFNKILNLIL